MPIRWSLPFAAALALVACTPAPDQAPPDQASKASEPKSQPDPAPKPKLDPVEDSADYTSFGMPDPGLPWSVDQYKAAYKAITAIAKHDFKLLPRDGSPTFSTLTDLDQLAQLGSSIGPEQLAGLSLSIGMTHMVYGDQVRREPSFEREHLILTAALLRVTTKLAGTVAGDVAEAEALRSQAQRLEGVLKFRHGVYEIVDKMLEPAPNTVIPATVACAQLARVIDETAPLLLADERAAVVVRVQACASAGAEAEDVATLERALAPDAPTAALVTALLDDHREYAANQPS